MLCGVNVVFPLSGGGAGGGGRRGHLQRIQGEGETVPRRNPPSANSGSRQNGEDVACEDAPMPSDILFQQDKSWRVVLAVNAVPIIPSFANEESGRNRPR